MSSVLCIIFLFIICLCFAALIVEVFDLQAINFNELYSCGRRLFCYIGLSVYGSVLYFDTVSWHLPCKNLLQLY